MGGVESNGDRPSPKWLRLLAAAPLLARVDESAREQLLQQSRIVRVPTGQTLWREGEAPQNVAVVLRGLLKIVRRCNDGEAIVGFVTSGEAAGEAALATGSRYHADAVCVRPSVVALVPTEGLRAIAAENPELLRRIASSLAHQLIRLYRHTQDLRAGDVQQRLARLLVRLADRVGEPFPGGVYLPVRLRLVDLAAMAGTTAESVSRRFSAWKRAGLVTAQPLGYLVGDLERLRRIADADEPARPRAKQPRGEKRRARFPAAVSTSS